MTVKDMITELSNYPEDAGIVFGYNWATVEAALYDWRSNLVFIHGED